MTSTVEDIDVDHMDHIPDFSSILEHGITTHDSCRIEKDSSNDEDMFGDSSQEGSQAALDIFPFDPLSVAMPLDECPAEEAPTILPTLETDIVPPQDTIGTQEMEQVTACSTLTADEDCIRKMNEEEKKFYENYVSSNSGDISSLRCTVCSEQLFVVTPANIKFHPILGVLICKGCRDYYNNGEFSKDDSGYDEYCRWCAEGGSLICCDTCTNVFCKSCLRRCLGRAVLWDMENGGGSWSCLVCNQQPLWPFRALSRLVLTAMEKKKRNQGRRTGQSLKGSTSAVGDAAVAGEVGEAADAAAWLSSCVIEAEKLTTRCKSLARKAGEILAKRTGQSNHPIDKMDEAGISAAQDSDKIRVVQCCRQLRKAVVATNFALKMLDKKIVRNYKRTYGSTAEIEDVDSISGTGNSAQSGDGDPSSKRLVLKIKNFRDAGNKKQGRHDYYAEIRGSPQVSSQDKTKVSRNSDSAAAMKTEPQAERTQPEGEDDDDSDQFFDTCSTGNPLTDDQSNDATPRPKAEPSVKTEDLQSSRAMDDSCGNDWEQIDSLSDLRADSLPSGGAQKVKTEPQPEEVKEATSLNGSKAPSSSRNGRKSRRETSSSSSPSKSDISKSMDPSEKARRALLAESSSGDDSDDSLSDFSLLDSPNTKKSKERKCKREFLAKTPDIDMKLNSECAVVVRRIVGVNQPGKSENGADSEMDELKIKPKTEKRSSDEEQEESVASTGQSANSKSRKSRKERKAFRLSDLSSTSDSESDDWDLSGDTGSVARSTQESATGVAEAARVSTPIDPNEAVRQELLASSSSDDSDANNDEEPIVSRKSLKSKVAQSAPLESDTVGIEEDADANGIKCELLEEDDGEESGGKNEVKKSSKLLRIPKLVDSDDGDDSTAKLEPEVVVKKEEGEGKKKSKKTKDVKKKRRIHSDSDFESSEDDSEENKKKRKRKSKKAAEEEGADEDEDDNDDDDENSEEESKPKRRRRIKKQADSSDAGSDSDVQILNESENGGKIGRKNIKKILKNKNLEDKTKSAAREEDERRRRIAERQKRYNDVFTNDNALANAQTHHLVLDFDDKTKKELVTVHKNLVNKLKPHQVKGVKFMWDACFESVERIKTHKGSGCILAHCMGLGKSLQVVTLVHTVLSHPECQVNRVIVVCPLSTVLNWVNEFEMWLNKENLELEVYEMSSLKTNDLRMYTLRNWYETGGVMILGYDMFRNLTNDKKKGIKPKMREVFQKTLVDPGPDLVICDEGHLLKNEATATSKAMNRVRTLRRVVLTGTPLQNNLVEYHCMVQFVKPNLLGTKREFTNRFVNPIKNGQCADSTDHDVRLMKRRAHVLHKMLEGSVQRFDYSVLTPFLPPKHEYVISVKMSDLQIKMYQHYLDRCARGGPNSTTSAGRNKSSGLFADFQELGRVWTHPKALHLSQLRRDLKAITEGNEDSEGSLADFIDDGSGSESDDGGVVCLDESGDDKDDDEGGDEVKVNGWRSRTRAGRGNQPPPEEELGVTAPLSSTWWSQFVNDDDMTKLEHSGKLVLLMDILRQCELIGDKVLVFSQSLVSLDLIEEFLLAENDRMALNRINQSENQEDAAVGTWTLNADYFRLDGSTSAELRKTWTNHFNNPKNLRARLFLISTRAGGLGINLVAANRVIIFDASWNPSHDVQSIFRIYRFGQKKPCYVYRFLAQGTMEEKIYDRQVTKLSLSCRVVDEQQIERHFNSADLNELYRFEADSHTRRPTPPLPKDRLLAELMIQRKEWIVTFHEHDSLLENKEDEELNEDERKAAWDDFENEKRGMVHTVPNLYAGASSDMSGMMGLGALGAMGGVMEMITGRYVAGIPLTNIAAMIMNSNPGITQDEFLGRLRLTVEQLQNFSVQQAAASGSTMNSVGAQQPGDAQRLLMQRQVAADQLKRQFGPPAGSIGNPGPSGVAPIIQPRSRGRPPIGPHQRTDLYGLAPVIYSSAASGTGTVPPAMPGRSSSSTQPGNKAPPKT